MPWPTPQDYNEAIQNPAIAFQDPQLRPAQPELTALGLPRPITGNFASVYRMHCSSRDLAVRCFWREYADMRERYRAISDHLATAHLPYTVAFEYLPDGVRIRGHWYPLLKMEWLDGQLLSEWVEARLGDRMALSQLAQEWVAMVAALERAGVAHGDLQHGNVLLVGDELKLVDYDGMYVPALQGRDSHELGHPHYQHPRRTGRDFGACTDRFSAWVIYLSLLALSESPELWAQLGGGDECLLLRRQDFLQPEDSMVLAVLKRHPDRRARELASRFRHTLDDGPDRVPSLAQALLMPAGRRRRNAAGLSTTRSLPRPAATSPPWLTETLAADQVRITGLDSSLRLPRLILLLFTMSIALTLVLVPLPIRLVSLLAEMTAAGAALWIPYRTDPVVRRAHGLRRSERGHLRSLQQVRRRIERLERKLDRLRLEHEQSRATLLDWQRKHQAKVMRWREEIAGTCETAIGHLERQLADNDALKRTLLEDALAAVQRHHREVTLRRHSILSADIPSMGRAMKCRLWLRGLHSAADVGSHHAAALDAIGNVAAAGVLGWRLRVEKGARRTMPSTLPPRISAPIKRRHARARSLLERDRARFVDAKVSALRQMDMHLDRERTHVSQAVTALDTTIDLRGADLKATIEKTAEPEPAFNVRLARVRRELEMYRELSWRAYLRHVIGT